ncbi:1,3-beta-D-glucan synthase [Metarhizium acridum]|nr:1,3-beta-D-glucan synthase [Metarhizium acridum]
MSGYPGGHNDHYDDGYGHHGSNAQGNADSYYQDDQYYDNGYDARGGHGGQNGDGYYDESIKMNITTGQGGYYEQITIKAMVATAAAMV